MKRASQEIILPFNWESVFAKVNKPGNFVWNVFLSSNVSQRLHGAAFENSLEVLLYKIGFVEVINISLVTLL